MDFRRKLKIRLYVAIAYVILGIALIVTFNIIKTENDFLSSFGLALVVIGVVHIRRYFLITKNEETIKRRQIAETDERNIAIADKAKSIAFIVYVVLAAVAIIVLELLEYSLLSIVLSLTIGLLVAVYWIAYWTMYKKS
jgi:purine-cytosine permease-like protein